MKSLILLLAILASLNTFSQIGIGTTDPKATLHVYGASSNIRIDGLGAANPSNNGVETPLAVDANGMVVLSSKPTMEFVAMGKIAADGTAIKISGATVSKSSTGNYQINLTKAQSDNDYIISLTIDSDSGNSASVARYYDQTTASFKVNTTSSDVEIYTWFGAKIVDIENEDVDSSFMFTVYKIN
jgi:hypothetical protein